MEATYIALMRKEKKSDFGVDFPDFPGCITAGRTLDEAKDMAVEALQGHIESMQDEGYEIPSPSPLEKIMADPDNTDAVAFLVSVYPPKTKAKRINVTIPEDVLDRVDRFVKTNPVRNRSQFLTMASEEYISLRQYGSFQKKSKKLGSGKAGKVTTK